MKFLVIEDDAATAELVRNGLASDYHSVEVATDGTDGSFLARNYDYDAIVLDYSLPKKNGLTICKEVRAAGKPTPILFLSVVGDIDTKLAALDHGADDYLTKPFSFVELYARLRALSRRPVVLPKPVLCLDDLVLDSNRQTVTRSDKTVVLTRKEFGLLEYMMRHPGIVLSRAMLMEHVWTADSDPFSNTIEAHMRNLRKKLNAAGNRSNLIRNVAGRGYIIEAPEKHKAVAK